MNPKHPKLSMPAEQLSIVWQCASLLISYPDQQLVERAGMLRASSALAPEHVGGLLRRFLDHVESTPLQELAVEYVRTFDHQRRCCLFLTYFAHGDTRKRGVALLKFKQAYKKVGLELSADELPDHLAVVLEFGAAADLLGAWALLLDHRAGLELLRMALRDEGSPWAPVVEAVTATLPPLRGHEMDAVRRLVAQGPPDEEVGLAPFSPAQYIPSPASQGTRATTGGHR